MFLENLSVSVLKLCDANHYTYESASERCDISTRYLGSIARRKTSPSIRTLEKLCVGFGVTPNDLLLMGSGIKEQSYREPMPIVHIRGFRGSNGLISFPVCPRCNTTMSREYQLFCDRCGQRLDWSGFDNAMIIFPKP